MKEDSTMAKRIRLSKKQQKAMVREYAASLAKRTLIDAGWSASKDFEFDNKVKPVIKFTEKALLIIKELVSQCEKEIAWNGLVNYDAGTNTYEVYDILIFPQVVTGTSVNVDETKYAMWLASLTNEQLAHMRFHGHSHVNMGVTPSGIDTGYQNEMLQMQIKDYYIFMIFNKRGDMNACIYDVENNVAYENKDIIIESESQLNPYKDLVKGWIEDYVSAPAPVSYTRPYNGQQYPGYWANQLINGGSSARTPGEKMMQESAINDPSIRRYLD